MISAKTRHNVEQNKLSKTKGLPYGLSSIITDGICYCTERTFVNGRCSYCGGKEKDGKVLNER